MKGDREEFGCQKERISIAKDSQGPDNVGMGKHRQLSHFLNGVVVDAVLEAAISEFLESDLSVVLYVDGEENNAEPTFAQLAENLETIAD
jgi:hypothetical protein